MKEDISCIHPEKSIPLSSDPDFIPGVVYLGFESAGSFFVVGGSLSEKR